MAGPLASIPPIRAMTTRRAGKTGSTGLNCAALPMTSKLLGMPCEKSKNPLLTFAT
jgi:hypothetical protein